MAHETQFYSSQAPAYYIDREHEVNTSGILTKPYAPSTLRAIGQVKDDWERFYFTPYYLLRPQSLKSLDTAL